MVAGLTISTEDVEDMRRREDKCSTYYHRCNFPPKTFPVLPTPCVKPVPELEEAVGREILRCSPVEMGVKLVNHRFKPNYSEKTNAKGHEYNNAENDHFQHGCPFAAGLLDAFYDPVFHQGVDEVVDFRHDWRVVEGSVGLVDCSPQAIFLLLTSFVTRRGYVTRSGKTFRCSHSYIHPLVHLMVSHDRSTSRAVAVLGSRHTVDE